jgi:DNA-binding beta-propeller fold protein YncE
MSGEAVMSANNNLKNKLSWAIGIGFFLCVLSAAGAATKLKVTNIRGADIYKEPMVSQPLTTFPLNAKLEAEAKIAEFWKVTFILNGVKTSGYVHEYMVTEVSESEVEGAAAAGVPVKTQEQLAAEIQVKLDESRELIQQQKDLVKAVENLRSLIAKVFCLEDLQQQKQKACEIYLWTGYAFAKQGDDAAAVKEFRNMFEVDYRTAKNATERTSESSAVQLINIAEKQYNGVFEGYALQIETVPEGASIKIDGQTIGLSPSSYTTINPRIALEIEKEGYRPINIFVPLKDSRPVLSYTLESLGRTVQVSSNPPGASVFLDDRDIGKVTDCEIPLVPHGPHTLTLKKEYYADWEEQFTVPEGNGPVPKSALLTVKEYASVRVWSGADKKFYIFPKALALDKSGNFYVADESVSKLRKFNPEGLFQKSWGSEGQQFRPLKIPSGIAIDGKGNFYVTDKRSCTVTKFDKNGQSKKTWGQLGVKEGELNGPLGIVVDRNNDVLVVDAGNSRIVKYSSEGELKKTWGKPGSGQGQFTMPTGVAVSKNNDVFVVEQGRVQKFTTDGAFIGSFGKMGSEDGEIKRPSGICLDGDDYIYLADTGNNRVLKFALDGRFICQWGGSGAGGGPSTAPIAVAVNEKGSVFVLESNTGRIQEFRKPSK